MAGGGGGGGGGIIIIIKTSSSSSQMIESHKQEEEKDTWYKVIHRTGVFRRLRNAAVSASLTVCGRAFQSLEAELQKGSETKLLFSVFFSSTWNQ